jgi:hypothetical protein
MSCRGRLYKKDENKAFYPPNDHLMAAIAIPYATFSLTRFLPFPQLAFLILFSTEISPSPSQLARFLKRDSDYP